MTHSNSDKVLIIHADDLGMSHSVNEAVFDAFEKGVISSASVMPPCQWFWEAVQLVHQRPDLDIGVHLTLTSEYSTCRWRPVSCLGKGSGLVDDYGMLHRGGLDISASSEALIREILAQVSLCIQCGISPTHLDSHMFVLFHEARVLSYVQAAMMVDTPYLLPYLLNGRPVMAPNYDPKSRIVHRVISANRKTPAESWEQFYIQALNNLEPGVNELIVHPGFNTPELRAIAGSDAPWGAEWRQRDYNVLVSEGFTEALDRNRITVVSWKSVTGNRKD